MVAPYRRPVTQGSRGDDAEARGGENGLVLIGRELRSNNPRRRWTMAPDSRRRESPHLTPKRGRSGRSAGAPSVDLAARARTDVLVTAKQYRAVGGAGEGGRARARRAALRLRLCARPRRRRRACQGAGDPRRCAPPVHGRAGDPDCARGAVARGRRYRGERALGAAAARTGWRCEVRIRRDPKRPWRTGKLDHGPIAVAALNLDKASGSGFAEDRTMSRNRSFSRIALCFAALCIGPGVRRDTRVLSCWLARLPEV